MSLNFGFSVGIRSGHHRQPNTVEASELLQECTHFFGPLYICYIIILNRFRAVTCSSSGGKIVLLQPLISSLSVNSRTVRRLRADSQPAYCTAVYRGSFTYFQSDDTRGCNNTICPPEDDQGTARNMLRIIK